MRIAIDFIIICNLLFSICYLDKRLCSLPKQGCLSGLLVVSGICSLSGNAGTGMYQRGAKEQGCDFAPVAGTETTKKQIPDTTYTLIPHPVLADYTDAIQKDKL